MGIDLSSFFMPKRFHWKDLQKIVDNYSGVASREIMAVTMLLEGHKVDISAIPSRKGFRQPASVKYQLRRTFSDHEGVVNEGSVYWIPELYGKD